LQPGGHRFDPGQLHQNSDGEIRGLAALGAGTSCSAARAAGPCDDLALVAEVRSELASFWNLGRVSFDVLFSDAFCIRGLSQPDVGRQMRQP
jgi:hypothetical protein